LLETPKMDASTALTPNIRTGINKGNIIKDNNAPLRRAPNISAAPIEPMRLNVGVPKNNVITRTNN